MAAELHVLLAEAQLFAEGDADLLLHDVDAGDHLGDRVLDLHARVHLDEVELVVLVQELESAGAAVAHFLARIGAAVADALDQAPRDMRRGGFLDHLLVAALHRAVALAEPDGLLVLVGQDLDFHMARVLEELLHVDLGIAEGTAGFFARHVDGVDQRGFGMHHAHAAATAAAGGLDDHRVADAARGRQDFLGIVGQGAVRAGHARHAGLDHGLLGRDLVAHQADAVGGRADKDEAGLFHALGKVRVLGQEAVAGVDGLRIGHLGGRDDGGHVQVRQRRRGRADADGFVCQAHVLGLLVGLGVHHDRLDAQLAAGALDAKSDFAAVRDQNFFKHGLSLREQ